MPGAENRTADFRDAVKRRRSLLGLPTPAAEILPPAKKRAAFTTDALSCLEKIATMAGFLRDNHAAYLLDDELRGMSEAERDEIDAETQRFLKACNDRIDGLKQQAVAATVRETAGGQLQTHYQAMLQLLYERLQEVAQVFDVHRGHRLQKAVDAKEARLGAAAAAAVEAEARRASGGGSVAAAAAASSTAPMEPAPWGDDEVLSDEDLDEQERAQLLLENEALQKELSCLSQQAREAESKVMEISNLSHLFATKVPRAAATTAPSPGPRTRRARSSQGPMASRVARTPTHARAGRAAVERHRAALPAGGGDVGERRAGQPVHRLGREALARLPAAGTRLPHHRVVCAALLGLVL